MLKLTTYTNESISRKILYYYGRMIYISEAGDVIGKGDGIGK